MGEDLGRLGSGPPQNLRWGTPGRPMHSFPQYFETTVIGREAKYELTKKGLHEEFRVVK